MAIGELITRAPDQPAPRAPASPPSTSANLALAATPPADVGGHGDETSPTPNPPRKAPKVIVNTGTPERSEVERVGQIINLFTQARAYRRPMVQRWRQAVTAHNNDFWKLSVRPDWMPSPQIPEIYAIVDSLVSWEMDQRPTYTISPQALPHTGFAQMFLDMSQNLEAVLQASYVVNSEEVEWAKINRDKYVYGTGIAKTTWDMTLAGGMGDARTLRLDPFHFYPDPQATSLDDANYFIEARRMSIQELDRRWPGTAKLFPSGGTDHEIDPPPTQLNAATSSNPVRANPAAIAPATSPRWGQSTNPAIRAVDIPGVTVLECWVREHDVHTATDINTREPATRVFDEWRVIIVAGNRIIMDEPAENLWSSGCHPYSRIVQRDEGEFWGQSMVLRLASAQRSLNRLLASVQQNIELTGNPIFKDGGGMGRQNITNRPGQTVRLGTNPVQQQYSDWMKPPPLHPAMFQMIQYIISRMEIISGLSAIMKGSSPGGRNAEGVIDSLQEAGFVRVRSSLTFLESGMRDAGAKKADLIIENYTTPRLISIAGPGGERTSLALKSRHFQIPSSTGAVPLRYQLLVDVGSQRHTSRQMREDRAVQMFTLGLIDRDAALTDLNYPNATAVAARMDAHDQAMLAAGVQPGPNQKTASRA